jgi:hypothetical protein
MDAINEHRDVNVERVHSLGNCIGVGDGISVFKGLIWVRARMIRAKGSIF